MLTAREPDQTISKAKPINNQNKNQNQNLNQNKNDDFGNGYFPRNNSNPNSFNQVQPRSQRVLPPIPVFDDEEESVFDARIVSQEKMKKLKPILKFASAVTVWLITALGSILAFGGGTITSDMSIWSQISTLWTLQGLYLGLLIQIIVTLFEWSYADERTSAFFVVPFLVSVAMTIKGYWPLADSLTITVLTWFTVASPTLVLITKALWLTTLGILVDLIPEWALVYKEATEEEL